MVELIWDGKYDSEGKRTAPTRVSLPFQTVETVNESAQQRQMTLDLFSAGRDPEWRNRLIWGDKKYVLPSLLDEFAGKVDLIYIDPPFATGEDFSFQAQVGDEEFTKEPNVIEQKAYRDTWGRGLDSYLQWFYETALILYELLSTNGSLFVHLDDNVGAYAKVILDEIFGRDCYQNEVIWQRTDPHNDARSKFGNIHDSIYWFSKSKKPNYYPDQVRTNLSASGLAEFSLLELEDKTVVNYKENEHLVGRRFKVDDATWRGNNPEKKFTWRGATPSHNREWMYTFDEMEEALARGELYLRNPERGAARCKKSYLDLNQGILLQDIWTDAGRMKGGSSYATQKPEALLERIIKSTTNEHDLVFDCFCGSGTTSAVAEKLNRRWITCDLGRFAIHLTRKRLLSIEGIRPFVVQNLGKYERQIWQKAEFGQRADQIIQSYRRFLLDLYHADPVEGYMWLHGRKAGRMVHVGTVDSPITPADVTNIATDFRRAIGTGKDAPKVAGVDILGWDFALDMNETVRQTAESAGLNVRFIRIPREVLESKAVEQGDIRFFELAALSTNVTIKKRDVSIELTDFMIPPDDVPEEVIKAVKNWSEWIDYWAVDFNYRDDTFHNEWQTFRSRKDRSLQLSVNNTYDQAGTYTVLVKVIDILGNDTTKALQVEVK